MAEDSRTLDGRSGHRAAEAVAAITRACWIAILALTATFHFIRGAPVDAWIFFGGAAVVTLDALGWLHVPLRSHPDDATLSRRVLAVALIAVASLVLAVSPLYGGADTAVVVGVGILLLPVVWADRVAPAVPTTRPALAGRATADPRGRALVKRAAIAWSGVLVFGCVWEIGTFFLGRASLAAAQQFPPLSDLIDPLLTSPGTRLFLVAVWLAGGYALLRRGSRS